MPRNFSRFAMCFYPLAAGRIGLLAALVCLALAAGCQRTEDAAAKASAPADADSAAPATIAGADAAAADRIAPRDEWEVLLMAGQPAGFSHTLVDAIRRDGQDILQVRNLQQVALTRYATKSTQESRFTSHETREGRLLDFIFESSDGTNVRRSQGQVLGGKLVLTIEIAGKTEQRQLDWSNNEQGFFGPTLSLLQHPLQPGEKRTFRSFEPSLNVVATQELTAADYEPTAMGDTTATLLRVDAVMQFAAGNGAPMTLWCDRNGEIVKQVFGPLEVRRSSREAAQPSDATAKTASLDIGWDLAVKLDRPIERPHQTRRVRYEVRLDDGDPSQFFPSGATQKVVRRDAHTAEITVYAIRPGVPGNADTAAEQATADDSRPNTMIQSDDPRVVQRAEEAAGRETDPWQTALKLERYVKRTIVNPNYAQAFATAAEVARNPSGDCSEHAVLLAGLARARGIPARAAMGLIYMDGAQSMNYHMWTELFLDGRWIPFDGTLGLGGIGAAHLKMATSNFAGDAGIANVLPVLQIAGKLKIKVLDVEGPATAESKPK